MKIIVTYASAGAGHFKAAEAVYNYIKEHCPDINVQIIDALNKASALFKISYTFGYSLLVTRLKFLWWLAFWITDSRPLRPFTGPIASAINRLNTPRFARFLIEENPDVIISTHFLPSQIISRLKKSEKIKSRLVTIITDFGVHSFWISPLTDIFIVASQFSKAELISKGIAGDRIKDFGIPVHSKFLMQYDRGGLCKKFSIDENKFTVLIMTGSFGLGPLEKIVDALYRDVQVLVVCAANKRLYARLQKRGLANVRVFGFIDNPEELMAVSDMIITKPGGLTISEVMGTGLVPVFISAIPGQEAANVEALKRYGIGLCAASIEDIKNIVLDFRDHRDKLEMIKDKIKKLKKPDCLKEICNVVCQGGSGITG
jgi:processive 1,2-diacylglycerol beta-glucosyltransferase